MNINTLLTIALPLLSLAAAVLVGIMYMKKTGNAKKAFTRHFVSLAVFLCVAFCFSFIVSGVTSSKASAATASQTSSAASGEETAASAETAKTETTPATTNSGAGIATGLALVGAGLSIGLAAIGAGIALSAGAPAAIGAVAENPKSFGKSIIFVALGEAVAIYGFIIAILMVIKIPDLPTL